MDSAHRPTGTGRETGNGNCLPPKLHGAEGLSPVFEGHEEGRVIYICKYEKITKSGPLFECFFMIFSDKPMQSDKGARALMLSPTPNFFLLITTDFLQFFIEFD